MGGLSVYVHDDRRRGKQWDGRGRETYDEQAWLGVVRCGKLVVGCIDGVATTRKTDDLQGRAGQGRARLCGAWGVDMDCVYCTV